MFCITFTLAYTFSIAFSSPLKDASNLPIVTTASSGSPISNGITLKRASELLESINKQLNNSLANSNLFMINNQLITTTILPETLLYGEDNRNDQDVPEYDHSKKFGAISAASKDKRFEVVLKGLDVLEGQVNEAIDNFTSTQRYTYTAMLKPMLRHINQLRSNLTLLRNRLIGVAALSSIAEQVNQLTEQIGEALVGDQELPSSTAAVLQELPAPSKKDEQQLKTFANVVSLR